MRTVPADLIVDPVPHDFAPPISDDGAAISWTGTIGGKRYALGLRPRRNPADVTRALEHLREGVWQLHEFERLGRRDLMAYASVNRHPPKGPDGKRARPSQIA